MDARPPGRVFHIRTQYVPYNDCMNPHVKSVLSTLLFIPLLYPIALLAAGLFIALVWGIESGFREDINSNMLSLQDSVFSIAILALYAAMLLSLSLAFIFGLLSYTRRIAISKPVTALLLIIYAAAIALMLPRHWIIHAFFTGGAFVLTMLGVIALSSLALGILSAKKLYGIRNARKVKGSVVE